MAELSGNQKILAIAGAAGIAVTSVYYWLSGKHRRRRIARTVKQVATTTALISPLAYVLSKDFHNSTISPAQELAGMAAVGCVVPAVATPFFLAFTEPNTEDQ